MDIQIGEYRFKIRPPTEMEFDRYIDKGQTSPATAQNTLVRGCVEEPGGDALDVIFSRHPRVKAALKNESLALAGNDDEAVLITEDDTEASYRIGEQIYTIRRAGEAHMDDFTDALQRMGLSGAMTNLVLSCLTSPSEDDVGSIFERWPAHKAILNREIHRRAGGDLEVVRGKPTTC